MGNGNGNKPLGMELKKTFPHTSSRRVTCATSHGSQQCRMCLDNQGMRQQASGSYDSRDFSHVIPLTSLHHSRRVGHYRDSNRGISCSLGTWRQKVAALDVLFLVLEITACIVDDC